MPVKCITKTNFFKARRDELGMTQRDVALALDMTTGAVSLWETFNSTPRPELWDRLAKIYKVTPERIATEVLNVARHANA